MIQRIDHLTRPAEILLLGLLCSAALRREASSAVGSITSGGCGATAGHLIGPRFLRAAMPCF